MSDLTIHFDLSLKFRPTSFRTCAGMRGLYFIHTSDRQVDYPFNKSKLLYIGMSERTTNSIGSRLMGHYEGRSGNVGLLNYRKVDELLFTYINYEMLKGILSYSIESLESYFILDFVKHYGVYPICNNKSGFEITQMRLDLSLNIDWAFFEGKGHG